MMLCVDVGNSHIYGGVFKGDNICLRFRQTSKVYTSDEIGIFLKTVLRENNFSPELITSISICSVVPQIDYSLRSACIKYFSISPFFLHSGSKTGLTINYKNPSEIGADRIANSIAATTLFPNKNTVIIDFGTAITLCVISADNNYWGGAILPGLGLSRDALSNNTAKLSAVEILNPEKVVGRTTAESIQSGIYFGALGACKELLKQIQNEHFNNEEMIVIATGGFATLFEDRQLYHYLMPDLVLQGIKIAAILNQ